MQLPAESLPLNAFDFITAVDVFEHLPDPRATLSSLAAALRPGGVLFIHLPLGPDTARPMHLWHDPTRLLSHLAENGLFLRLGSGRGLERATGQTLILRRGKAPCYALNAGLELRPGPKGGILLSTRPLAATRLNQPAFGLLVRLDSCRTAAEVAAETPWLSLINVTTFLDDCERRRLLVRHPHHLGANVTRYYSLPLLAAGLLWPPLLPTAAILFLLPPVVDHRRLRPRLSLLAFAGLYWLEMAAYQIGVWRGCWKWRTLRPLLPVLRLG